MRCRYNKQKQRKKVRKSLIKPSDLEKEGVIEMSDCIDTLYRGLAELQISKIVASG